MRILSKIFEMILQDPHIFHKDPIFFRILKDPQGYDEDLTRFLLRTVQGSSIWRQQNNIGSDILNVEIPFYPA